jgi:hypothetical protein
MAVIKSGAGTDQLTIDPTSKAARVTLYNSDGTYSGQKATYRAATLDPFVAAVTADVPFFLIEGSASKTIIVKRIAVSGITLTAVAYLTVNVTKHATAASGGVSVAAVAVPLDSGYAAASATVKHYTTGPTPGTLVGTVATNRSLAQATVAAAAGLPRDFLFDFGDIPESEGIVLRGVAQGLALVWATAPATTPTLAVDIEWTEE